MKYPAYPRYQDSGVEWLGELPEHWKVIRNKLLFSDVDERSMTGKEELLTVSHITGITPRSEKDVNMFLAESLEDYKQCKRGDLIINTMWAYMGALGLTSHDGVVSPSYNVYRPKKSFQLHPVYFDYLFRIPSHITEIRRWSKGVWESRLRLYPDSFFSMVSPLPPFEEQATIAGFLDIETSKIDALITKQEQLIELLLEKRQAIISNTVTKGLNPNVPMKDSGTRWMDAVPSHWKKYRIKHLGLQSASAIVDGPFGSSVDVQIDYVNEGIPVIRTVNITDKGFSEEDLRFMRREKFEELKRHAVYPGDLLFSKVGTIGNTCLLPSHIEEAILSTTGSCKISLDKEKVDANYVVYLLQSLKVLFAFLASANVQPFLNLTTIKNVSFFLPSRTEQSQIVDYINNEVEKVDSLIYKVQQSILLIREHRTALISAAVTGKIDVRKYIAREAAV